MRGLVRHQLGKLRAFECRLGRIRIASGLERTERSTSLAGTLLQVESSTLVRYDRDVVSSLLKLQRKQLANTPGFGTTPQPRQTPNILVWRAITLT